MKDFNIYLTGVGGQGIGLISEIILRAADHAGHAVKSVDTHGLAQRGGIVVSQIRMGDGVFSPLISEGTADIAIALFYRVMWAQDMAEATRAFLEPFMRGYLQEHDLDPAWLATIPLFLKMREIDLYGVIHGHFDLAHEDDPWIVAYMRGRRERIHADAPYVALDFGSVPWGSTS